MSPSWIRRRAATLVLSPAGVGIARPGQAPVFEAGSFASPLQAAEAARSWLEKSRPRLRLNIVLAGTWGRCLLTPPLVSLPARDDLAALARLSVAEIHGPQSADWVLRTQPQGPGQPMIVSAIEPAWLQGLQQFAASLGLQLGSLEPLLAACWNRSRRKLPARAAWFALAEPGRVQLLALERGRWSSLSSTRCETEGAALPTLLHREAQCLERQDETGEAWVYSTFQVPPQDDRWRWQMLAPLPAQPFANLLGVA